MSLSIRRSENPESKVRGTMKSGHLFSVDPLRPLEALIAPSTVGMSRPNSAAAAIASHVASRWVAESRLFSALTACPAPTSPTGTTRAPSTPSSGRTRATSPGAPPAMMVRRPLTAPATPPETGASTMVTPRPAASAASSLVTRGSEEPMSTITVPGAIAGSSSATTRRTTAESGSMRMTAAAPRAAARRLAAVLTVSGVPARSAQIFAAASLTSYPWTW